jgi:hypothetical protein
MFIPFYPAVIVPVDEIVTMVVAPYLIIKFPPDSKTEKLVVAKPVALIPHEPDAPVPVGEGTSVPIARPRFVLAADAVDAFVPPLAIVTGALSWLGGIPPEESRLLEKLAKFIAWVILYLSAFLFQILSF